jgi:hypothetical protein
MVFWRAVCRLFGTLLVMLVAQVVALPNVLAYEEGRTEYGARLRLTSLPARVRLDTPVPDLFDGGRPPLLRAIATWNAGACSSPLLVMTEEDDDVLIEVRPILDGWKYGPAIAAHTSVESDPFQGDIRHVIIEIDATRKWSDAAAVPSGAIDLESVLLHELGHAVGLEHSRNQDAIMRAGIKPGQARRILHDDDGAGVCSIVKTFHGNGTVLAFMKNLWRSKSLFMTTLLFAAGICASAMVLIKRMICRHSLRDSR